MIVVAAGCGGDGDRSSKTTTEAAVEQPGPISITRPGAAKPRVKATDGEAGDLAASTELAGRAEPGEDLVVSAGCRVTGCVVRSTVGEDGRWRAKVELAAPRDAPVVEITATYSDSPIVGPKDAVAVELVAPKGAARRGDGARRAGGAAGGDARGDSAGGSDSARIPGIPSGGSGGRLRALVMIGDSLAQGTEPFLPGQLGGWTVRQDAARGRTLGQGMAILGSTDTGGRPVALAFSLFTNDDPRNVGALESAVRRSVARAGANGCAIWATIARPAVGGVSYGAANARLRRLDAQLGRRLAVVPWAERARGSGWLVRDGVHATPAGYRARAALYAQAARSC